MLRQSDILARFGGDEFIVALPETSVAQATSVADKLRQLTIPVPEGLRQGVPPIRLSVGASHVEEDTETSHDVLEAADQSLYAHKRRTPRVSHHANLEQEHA